jgi:hypothetical protein
LEGIYGITPDFSFTIVFPYQFGPANAGNRIPFWGIRTKWRFYRRDDFGKSFQFALHTGVLRRTQSDFQKNRYLVGISNGFESRRHYYFSDVRYMINADNPIQGISDIIQIDIAYGIRPYKTDYLKPDLILLTELNSQYILESGLSSSSPIFGTLVFFSPGMLLSYRNIMIKSGVQIPLLNYLKGTNLSPETSLVLGIEFHFPPLH